MQPIYRIENGFEADVAEECLKNTDIGLLLLIIIFSLPLRASH